MARAKTTFDAFNAIAEPRRRVLIEQLAANELTVSELVRQTGWNQPMVSKHLGVLKAVGIVMEKKQGRYRLYSVNAVQLKPVQEWVIQFEKYWANSLDLLDDYLHDIQSKQDSV